MAIDEVISGQVFTQPVILEGRKHYKFRQCEFKFVPIAGAPPPVEAMLWVRDCMHLTIEECYLHDLPRSAIELRSTGVNYGVTLANNRIENVLGSGIAVERGNNHHIEILGNRLTNTGMANDETHAFYIQMGDVLLQYNHVNGTKGNAFSMRSSGKVWDNTVSNAEKTALRYFPDHAPGLTKQLDARRNHFVGFGTANPTVSLLYPPPGLGIALTNLIDSFVFTENFVFSRSEAFRVQSPEFSGRVKVVVFDNDFHGTVSKAWATVFDNRELPPIRL